MTSLLILGIDGASWELLDRFIEKGCMPHLKVLKKNFNFGTLTSTMPPITPAAWSSFHTGKNPGHHGVIDFVYWNKKMQMPDLVDSSWLGPTIWDGLQEKTEVAVLNVPMTYPAQRFSADVVSGILTPDIDSPWASNEDLKKEIEEHLNKYEPVTMDYGTASQVWDDPYAYVDSLSQKISLRFELAEERLESKAYSVLMLQLQVLDWVQHVLWCHLDPAHPKHDKRLFEYIGRQIYQLVDTQMNKLWLRWQDLHQKSSLLLVSDHGFQLHKKRIKLGNIFYQAGLLDRHGGAKQKINKLMQPVGVSLKNNNKVQLLGKSMWGFVYISEGGDSEKIYGSIKELTTSLKDPETNELVIEKVWKREELYSGPKLEVLPEFLIQPRDGYSITAAVDKSDNLFVPVEAGKDFHLGYHHADGIILSTIDEKLPSNIVDCAKYIKTITYD